DLDPPQSVHDVAEGLEVDGHVLVERDPCDPADRRLRQVAGTILALELSLQRARCEEPGLVGNFESSVDLLRVIASVLPGVDADIEVPRNGSFQDPPTGGVDADHHYRVGQPWGIVLRATVAKREDVDALPVFELPRNRAGRRLHLALDQLDRVVQVSDLAQEAVDTIRGHAAGTEEQA